MSRSSSADLPMPGSPCKNSPRFRRFAPSRAVARGSRAPAHAPGALAAAGPPDALRDLCRCSVGSVGCSSAPPARELPIDKEPLATGEPIRPRRRVPRSRAPVIETDSAGERAAKGGHARCAPERGPTPTQPIEARLERLSSIAAGYTSCTGSKRTTGSKEPGGRWCAETALRRDLRDTGSLQDLDPEPGPRGDPPRSVSSPFAGSLIGETGFEPATARPPAGCATRLRHSPWKPQSTRSLSAPKRATGLEPATSSLEGSRSTN